MGLKITDEIFTNKGVTTEAYINVERQIFKKGNMTEEDSFDINVNMYMSEAARLNDPLDTCESAQVYRYFGYANIGSPGQLEGLKGVQNAFEFTYELLKASLEEQGFTVIDVD